MSDVTSIDAVKVRALKDLHGYAVVTGNGRRMNLESIKLLDIKGFHAAPNNPDPQVASITCQINLKNYGNASAMQATVTYSAPIPDSLIGTRDVQLLSDFAEKGVFDITVAEARKIRAEGFDYEVVGDRRTHLNGITADTMNEIIKHKLLGHLPASNGFDDSLVAEINDIIRSRLFEKLMMQADDRPTSTIVTKDIIDGFGKPIKALSAGAQNYRFLTTKSEGKYEPIYNPDLPPHLQLTVSTLLEYEAGYIVYIDTVHKALYPYGTPAPTKDKDINKFLETAQFDLDVVKISLGINNEVNNVNSISTSYHSLSHGFDADFAAKYVQELLRNPADIRNKYLSDAVAELLSKSKQSIIHRIKYVGDRRLDTV